MKVALLGGAFNPVTLRHIQIAQLVLNDVSFDEVWLMPCYNHKNKPSLVDSEIRSQMCQLACIADMRIRVFNYEIIHQLNASTYDTMQRLLNDEIYKNYHFSLIIGMDNALTFDTWTNHEALKQLMPFVVVSRGNYKPEANMWFMKAPHVYLQDNEPPISSTYVRELIKTKGDFKQYLHPDVVSTIINNNLYGVNSD